MTPDPFRDSLLAALPSLRAFAISLTFAVDQADDLVQDTLVRAWTHRDRFRAGTNLEAWLFTILRNAFYSSRRKARFEVSDPEGVYAERLVAAPTQTLRCEFDDFRDAFASLAPKYREVLALIAAEGLSYEDTARVCGVAVGTVKSRVNRARSQLSAMLKVEGSYEFGPDHITRAALQPPSHSSASSEQASGTTPASPVRHPDRSAAASSEARPS
jgi:RNA polymerase sigma-70 factor (ECF subfamily)